MSGGSKMSLGSKMSKNSKASKGAKEKLLTASARAGLPLVMLEQAFLIPAQSVETVYIDATTADTMYGATDEHGTWCDGIAVRRLRAMIQGTADIYTAAGNRGIYTSSNSSGGDHCVAATAAKKRVAATTDDKKSKTAAVTSSSSSNSSKLLVLDGSVSGMLEAMLSSDVFTVPSIVSPLSAASDNRRLCMPDGTWLSLTSLSHLAIETLSVAHLSPSTLTAVAIVMIEPSRDEMIEGLVSAWLIKLNASSSWSDTVKKTLTEALSHRQLYTAEQHDEHTGVTTTHHQQPLHAMSIVPYSACFTVSTTGVLQYDDGISPSIALKRIRSMLLILEGMLDWYKQQQQQCIPDVTRTDTTNSTSVDSNSTSSKHVALQTYMLFVYAVTWGIGGHISTNIARHSFSDYIKAQMPQHVKTHLKDSSISLYDTVVDLQRAMLVPTETVMNSDTLVGIPKGIWTNSYHDSIMYSSSSALLASTLPVCNTMIEATPRVRGVGTALLHFTTYMGLNCVLQGVSGSGKSCVISHIIKVSSRGCPNPNNIANISIAAAQSGSSSSTSGSSDCDTSLAVLKQLRDTMVSKGTQFIQDTAASSVRRHSAGDTAMICKNALTKLLSNTDCSTNSSDSNTAAATAAATTSAASTWTRNGSVYVNASAYSGASGDQSGIISVIECALQRECSSNMQAPPGCSSCIIVIDDAHVMNECVSETLRGVIDGTHTINTAVVSSSSSSSKNSAKTDSSSSSVNSSNSKHGKLPNRVQVHPDYIGLAPQCDSYSDVRATRIIAATQYIDSTSRLWQQFVHLSIEEPDVSELTTVFNTALLQTFVGDRRSAYMHSSAHDGSNSSGTANATLVYNSDVMSAITRVGRMAIKILQLLSDSDKLVTSSTTNVNTTTNKYINYPTLLRLVKPFELAHPSRLTSVTSVIRMMCHEILREVVEPYSTSTAVTSAVKCMLSVVQHEASAIGMNTEQFDRLAVTLRDECEQSDSSRTPLLWTDINGLLALQVIDSINSKRSVHKSALHSTTTVTSNTVVIPASSNSNTNTAAYTEVTSAADEFGLTLDNSTGRLVVSNGVILNSKDTYGIKALTARLEYAIHHHYSTVLQWPLYAPAHDVNGVITTAAKPIVTQDDVCNVMKVVRQLALPNNNSVLVIDDSRGMRIAGGITCIISLATLQQGSTLYTIDGCVSHVTSSGKHNTATTHTSNTQLSTANSSSSNKASDVLRQAITAAITQYNQAVRNGTQLHKTVVLITNAAQLLTTHNSSILRALHACDVRDLFTDDELYRMINNNSSSINDASKTSATAANTTVEPATRYSIDRVYTTVVSIVRQCMTVVYCMSDSDRYSLTSGCSSDNGSYAAAIVKGCTVMRLATWSSVSQQYYTANNLLLVVPKQPIAAACSLSHVHLTGQLVAYNATTSSSATATAAHHEHTVAALADTTAVTVPQLYSAWMHIVSTDVVQAVLTTVSTACSVAYSTLHLEHLQPLKSSEYLVKVIDMYKNLCMIGATRLAARSAVLRKALANVDAWCIKGQGLTKQAQHIKALRAQYDKSIADLKDESAIVEAKKEAVLVKFTKQKSDVDEVRSKLIQRQARIADTLSPVTKLYENAASCIQQIRDDHLESLCSMSYGALGDSGDTTNTTVDGVSNQQHDVSNAATTAVAATASDDQHTGVTAVITATSSHLTGATAQKHDMNTIAKAAAAHTEMLLILESLAILMGYRTEYSDAIVQSTTTASANTATAITAAATANTSSDSSNSVSLVMRTFLMDPALTAKIEMFDTTADSNKSALQVVMNMFDKRGNTTASSPLMSAQPPTATAAATTSPHRKSMRTGRTSVLLQVKQSPATVYARSLATRCGELVNKNLALAVLTKFLTAVVVLQQTQTECALKTAAVDAEMKGVTDTEATITRSFRESTASVVALQDSIALRKQEVALKLGDIRGRMPLLLDIQGMESGLNDAIGMCRKELSDLEQIAVTWPGDCICYSAAVCAGVSALPYNYRQSILHAARTTAARHGCPVSIASTSTAAAGSATAPTTTAQQDEQDYEYDIDAHDNNDDNDDVYNGRDADNFDNNSANDNDSNDDGEFPCTTTYRYSDFCMGSMTCVEQIQSWVTANIHDKPATASTTSTAIDGDTTSNNSAEVCDVSVLAAGVSSLFGIPFEAAYIDAALLTLATTAVPLLIDPYGIGFKWLAKIYASSIILPAVPAARVVSTMIQSAQQCGSILVVNAIEAGLHIDLLTYLVHTGISSSSSSNSAGMASHNHTTTVHKGFRLILLGRDMPTAVSQSTAAHQSQQAASSTASSLVHLHESTAAMHAVQVIRFDHVVSGDTSGILQQEQSIADVQLELVTCSAYLKKAHQSLVDVLCADESVFAPKGNSSIESAKQLHSKGHGVTYTETLSRLAEQLFAFKATLERSEAQISNCQTKIATIEVDITATATNSISVQQQQIGDVTTETSCGSDSSVSMSVRCAVRLVAVRLHDALYAQSTVAAQLCDITSYAILQTQAAAIAYRNSSSADASTQQSIRNAVTAFCRDMSTRIPPQHRWLVVVSALTVIEPSVYSAAYWQAIMVLLHYEHKQTCDTAAVALQHKDSTAAASGTNSDAGLQPPVALPPERQLTIARATCTIREVLGDIDSGIDDDIDDNNNDTTRNTRLFTDISTSGAASKHQSGNGNNSNDLTTPAHSWNTTFKRPLLWAVPATSTTTATAVLAVVPPCDISIQHRATAGNMAVLHRAWVLESIMSSYSEPVFKGLAKHISENYAEWIAWSMALKYTNNGDNSNTSSTKAVLTSSPWPLADSSTVYSMLLAFVICPADMSQILCDGDVLQLYTDTKPKTATILSTKEHIATALPDVGNAIAICGNTKPLNVIASTHTDWHFCTAMHDIEAAAISHSVPLSIIDGSKPLDVRVPRGVVTQPHSVAAIRATAASNSANSGSKLATHTSRQTASDKSKQIIVTNLNMSRSPWDLLQEAYREGHWIVLLNSNATLNDQLAIICDAMNRHTAPVSTAHRINSGTGITTSTAAAVAASHAAKTATATAVDVTDNVESDTTDTLTPAATATIIAAATKPLVTTTLAATSIQQRSSTYGVNTKEVHHTCICPVSQLHRKLQGHGGTLPHRLTDVALNANRILSASTTSAAVATTALSHKHQQHTLNNQPHQDFRLIVLTPAAQVLHDTSQAAQVCLSIGTVQWWQRDTAMALRHGHTSVLADMCLKSLRRDLGADNTTLLQFPWCHQAIDGLATRTASYLTTKQLLLQPTTQQRIAFDALSSSNVVDMRVCAEVICGLECHKAVEQSKATAAVVTKRNVKEKDSKSGSVQHSRNTSTAYKSSVQHDTTTDSSRASCSSTAQGTPLNELLAKQLMAVACAVSTADSPV
jgi:Dynein heavy chain AAA lid domain